MYRTLNRTLDRSTLMILAAVTVLAMPVAVAAESKQQAALSDNGAAPGPSKPVPAPQNPSFPRPASTPAAAMPVNPPLAVPLPQPATPVATPVPQPMAAPAPSPEAAPAPRYTRPRTQVRRVVAHRERVAAAPRRKMAQTYRAAPVRYAVRRAAAAPGTDARGCRFVPRATGGGFRGDTIEVCG